ncbi:mitochondrial carrier domain-containing protein, partial [Spinellus fusiger]
GVAAVNALVFGSYTWLIHQQAIFHKTPMTENSLPPLRDVFFAGIGAGIITSVITCPMELVKVQLQNQTTTGNAMKYRGPIDCISKLYTMGGIRQCFVGMGSTLLREASFGPYFLCYEYICRVLTPKEKQGLPYEITGIKVVLAGGSTGIVAWCSTYPADVIKTRIQSEPYRYKGFFDCLRQCYREEGYRILFRGLTPTILRAFPSNAATFTAYTWTMNLLTCKETKVYFQQEEITL